jgi:hypothetical protein
MATIKVKYEALNSNLKSQIQTFTGSTMRDCWNQMYDFNGWLNKKIGSSNSYHIRVLEKREI